TMINRAGGVCVLLALASSPAATATAQEGTPPAVQQSGEQAVENSRDSRAIEILEAAQAAIGEATTIHYDIVKTMEKTDELPADFAMMTSISIGAKGSVRAAKDDQGRWVYRIDGTADDIGRKDAFEIVVLRGPQAVAWLDQENRTKVTANRGLARGRELSTENEFGVQFVFGEPFKEPFENIIAAPTLEALEPEVIDGTLCDVVRAGFGRPNDSGDKFLYIGRVDGLPRLVRDVLVTGFENRFAYTYQAATDELDTESLALEAPQGWEVAYRPESLRPDFVAPAEREFEAAAEGEGLVGFLVGDRAPAFDGFTMLGDEVSSESIKGTPAVLVFWASWVPGADNIVDFLTSTRENRGDGVALVTFAVRERNPDDAFNLLANAGLGEVPMMINPRDTLLAYGVTQAPLVVVVDAEGIIRYRSEGRELEPIFAEVNKTLDAVTAGE
ncbi:MAG: TlpA disulfide reductase family protein, partial [Planctomycetota bacterium]